MNDIIDVVITEIASYEKSVNEHSWFSDFFQSLKNEMPLDVFTLNYDTWMEQILEEYNDGFESVCDQYQVFSANKLFNNFNELSTVK